MWLGLLAASVTVAALLPAPDTGDRVDTAPATTSPSRADAPPEEVPFQADAPPEEPPSQALRFEPSGLVGGGFQNVVAISPDGRTILSGSDVAGIQRSEDGGASFEVANHGVPPWGLKVASLVYHPSRPGVVLAAAGWQGRVGGLLVSENDGRRWSVRSTDVRFSGNNNPDATAAPRRHPRSTGNLLVFDAQGALYAGSYLDGLFRSTDDGRTWQHLGLADHHIRGLAVDHRRGMLYVATLGHGIFRVGTSPDRRPVEALRGAPRDAEELLLLGDRLYVAAGVEGVVAHDLEAGDRWAVLIPSGTGTWTAIDGYRDGEGDHVVVGGHQVPRVDGVRATLRRSDDGGRSWSALSTAEAVRPELGGPGGPTWWLARAQPSFLPTGSGYTAAQLRISPHDHDTVLLAGRSGLWRSTDAGATWYPMVSGLGVTAVGGLEADPTTPGRVLAANTDYRLFVSDDRLRSVEASEVGATAGLDVALDASRQPATVVLATGDRDRNEGGELHVSAAPERGGWTSLELSTATGGKRPLAVAARRTGDRLAVVAAVEDSGIWRHDGQRWTRVDDTAMRAAQASADAELAWPVPELLYLYDRASGVWRSTDEGRTWERIWAVPSNHPPRARTAFLAADPADPRRLVVSVGFDGVHLLDPAHVGTVGAGIEPRRLGSVTDPGPVTFDPWGGLWVTERSGHRGAPRLLVSCDLGGSWTAVDDAVYRAAATNPSSITIDGDGWVYVALATNGVLVSRAPLAPGTACRPSDAE